MVQECRGVARLQTHRRAFADGDQARFSLSRTRLHDLLRDLLATAVILSKPKGRYSKQKRMTVILMRMVVILSGAMAVILSEAKDLLLLTVGRARCFYRLRTTNS